MLKRDTHGTRYAYRCGCRCELCRKTNADYQRQSGGNLRRGTRGELKRRWDDENRAVCACGNRMARTASVCRECFAREKHEALQARRARIAGLWADGVKLSGIAAALNTTVGAISVEMVRMRKDGWDLPYRYKVDATGRRAG